MNAEEIIKSLQFKTVQIARLIKNKGVSEFWLFKVDNEKTYVVEVFKVGSFALNDKEKVTEVPLETWLQFYKTKSIKDELINKIIEEFVKAKKIKLLDENSENHRNSYKIEKAGNFLVFYSLNNLYVPEFVVRVNKNQE